MEVSEKTEWTPECIIDRGKILLKFLKEHWELEHDFTEDEINKLLNITGVKQTSNVISDEPELSDLDEEMSEE